MLDHNKNKAKATGIYLPEADQQSQVLKFLSPFTTRIDDPSNLEQTVNATFAASDTPQATRARPRG